MGTFIADDVAVRVVPTISSRAHLDAVDLMASDPCSGTYVCDCIPCRLERQQRVRNGVRSFPNPWDFPQAA
jgi:hypothetical protein